MLKIMFFLIRVFSQVALLSGADESTCELAFQYGRNVGLSFQLVDDLLDFVSSAQAMGKPTATDLKLGLATAPVLFACEKVQISITINTRQTDYTFFFFIIYPDCFYLTSLAM